MFILNYIRGYAFNSTADFETVREIKEKFCFVSGNLEQDRKLSKETTCLEKEYRLPDNSIIRVIIIFIYINKNLYLFRLEEKDLKVQKYYSIHF